MSRAPQGECGRGQGTAMPIVDIPTLLLLYETLGAMVLGFLLAGAWYARTQRALWFWAGAFAAVTLTQLVRHAVEARWGTRLAFPIGHIGGLLHAVLLVLGTRSFLGRPLRQAAFAAVLAAAAGSSAWIVYGMGGKAMWSLAITHVAGGLVLAHGAWTALRERREAGSLAVAILGGVLATTAVVQLARGISMYTALDAVAPALRQWADDAVSFWLLFSVVLLVAQGFAILLAVNHALQREVRAMAEHDPMTGLLNRRGMDSYLQRIDRRRVAGVRMVVVADVDHFKAVNDGHGHGVGDEVLVQVGERLRSGAGEGSVVARFGGEEFVLVLEAATMAAVMEKADALRKRVGSEPMLTAAGPLGVTISMGAATYPSGASFEAASRDADEALYRAKRGGRNRVVAA